MNSLRDIPSIREALDELARAHNSETPAGESHKSNVAKKEQALVAAIREQVTRENAEVLRNLSEGMAFPSSRLTVEMLSDFLLSTLAKWAAPGEAEERAWGVAEQAAGLCPQDESPVLHAIRAAALHGGSDA